MRPPQAPDRLPSMEHNGTEITVLQHHGFSIPDRGALPKSRMLYGAKDNSGERHWKGSYEEMCSLIDRNFAVAPLASGVA